MASLHLDKIDVTIYKPKYRLTQRKNYQKTAIHILKAKPTIIGFSTWCITYPASLLLAKEIKTINPEIPIVFGGPQASILARQTLETFPFIDFILTGEADISLPFFVQEYHKQNPDYKKVPGLYFRNKSGFIQQGKKNREISNLDDLPVPAYNLFPKQKTINLDIGRGCPFKCTYCSTNDFFSKIYRVKSVKRIISEMMSVFKETKIRHFGFAHDMFTLNKKHILELCSELIDIKNNKGTEFIWTCSARIDCVSDEMLIQMKNAGCQSIFFGIETGSEKIQKSIKKNLDVSQAYKIADISREIDLNMHASFILGFPDETVEDVEKTLQCILKLAAKGAFVQISELSLLPGTPLYDNYKNKLKFDGKFSNFSHIICGHDELKLIKQYPEIFSSFYYLPIKTLKRQEIIFLNHLINKISLFRNTLFFLSENIQNDIISTNIFLLFKEEFNFISTQNRMGIPVVSHWIRIIKNYINYNKAKINSPYITDIFNYEAFRALLLTLYTGWQLVHREAKNIKIQDNVLIKPTPAWRILTTKYKLEKIIPSENQWEQNNKRCRKGIYKYLLIAVSEIKCKRIRINDKEVFLLEKLSQLYLSDYVKKVNRMISKKEVILWLRKLKRLGVIEIHNESIE